MSIQQQNTVAFGCVGVLRPVSWGRGEARRGHLWGEGQLPKKTGRGQRIGGHGRGCWRRGSCDDGPSPRPVGGREATEGPLGGPHSQNPGEETGALLETGRHRRGLRRSDGGNGLAACRKGGRAKDFGSTTAGSKKLGGRTHAFRKEGGRKHKLAMNRCVESLHEETTK